MKGDTVAQIKDRLSIQDALAPYVKLHRAGRSLVGLCPFHKEKTPSFHVSSERGTFHCFGCGVGGDAFSFIEKVEGVDFRGALKILAERAGVTIEYDPSAQERSSKLERLRDALSHAVSWYVARLSGSPAASYAASRGLSEETIREWRLGYAPDEWRGLLEALTAEGFSTPELIAAGLVKEADGKPGTYYDRFRNRLMFPIADTAGRVVGFTGRILPSETPPPGAEPAKYLNSPETELFRKSSVLYGMDRAKDAARTRGFTMLVEGQMDVLHAHQAGFKNAIALSGTALSEQHLSLMKRFSDNLMLVLDADKAGLSATARSAALALGSGMRVKAARLPTGKDPAELIGADSADFAARVKDAKPIVEFFLAVLAERESDPHRLLRAAEDTVLPLIAAIPSPLEREHFSTAASRALGLSPETLREGVARLSRREGSVSKASPSAIPPRDARSAKEVRGELLLGILRAYPDTPLAKRVEEEYRRITGVHQLPEVVLPESAVFSAEQAFGAEPAEGAADDLLRAFEEAVIREAYQEAVQALRRAEASGDEAELSAAQARCASISARLSAFGK